MLTLEMVAQLMRFYGIVIENTTRTQEGFSVIGTLPKWRNETVKVLITYVRETGEIAYVLGNAKGHTSTQILGNNSKLFRLVGELQDVRDFNKSA